MKILQLPDSVRYQSMSTEELRSSFLLESLFAQDTVELVYVDLDRTIIGSAVPSSAPLTLPCPHELRATSFLERRELGVLNIGGLGTVEVDGQSYSLDKLDALYIGRGAVTITFHSSDPSSPANFYLLSYPAHAAYLTTLIPFGNQQPTTIGAAETANRRHISKLIHLEGTRSCQLVMGLTQLDTGSIWNTLPPHTHMRRSEVYLYFDIPATDRVIHLMGPSQETRHLIVADKQVVISPGWSIHAGAGTRNYKFCWGMGGENQVYSDMDPAPIAELR
ncbi:5-dehydro-4-deoxy-D-glucuronate isomerase [Acidicapsa acidisoli]|uniref:5-dehydro-4-deoxy-D-glucuronate isomerase n=1 Tax=Acidicapsa acidisoli TaxID=1615681 RepID=UPI0021E0CB9D|nr:5-dehydro-4-deoxy-D-glucuronate isomerase [Acidicapsa acidisoli]